MVGTLIKTVHVEWGMIGYRSVGRGRPLVLVTGGSASIDDWAPSFIDLLARHHLVLALDNPGVGHTTLRPGKLTISRWADDVSDFIAALHLKRPDVWGKVKRDGREMKRAILALVVTCGLPVASPAWASTTCCDDRGQGGNCITDSVNFFEGSYVKYNPLTGGARFPLCRQARRCGGWLRSALSGRP